MYLNVCGRCIIDKLNLAYLDILLIDKAAYRLVDDRRAAGCVALFVRGHVMGRIAGKVG